MTWDPARYLRFAIERSLPFRHLVAAIGELDPSVVVDLGCGPGLLTETLLDRWPRAHIIGVDRSEEMIDHARRREIQGRLQFEAAEVSCWRAPDPADLMISNACFHWIDDHRALFDHLLPQLADNGVLAFQVPANHNAPSHTLLRDLCSSPRWHDRLDGLPKTGAREPLWYIDELGGRGLEVTAWQTTYCHVLERENPVLEWMKGSTLRPILERLPEDEHGGFLAEHGESLRRAYPAHNERTVFPFMRIFVVAKHRRRP